MDMDDGPQVEQIILEQVAYHDPINYGKLKRIVKERKAGCSTTRYREGLANLIELGFIARPGLTHEYVHITEAGWRHLGGRTPRHDTTVDVGRVPVCPICEEDALIEAEW